LADPTLPLLIGVGLDVREAVQMEDGYGGAALDLAARHAARSRDARLWG
jgi:hypothetical protein